MSNPRFDALLKTMAEIYDKKNHDYANDSDPYSNFRYAAMLTSIFRDPIDRVFATLIGIKLARIGELRKIKAPNNESLLDSLTDIAVYTAIWASMDVEVE